MSQDDTVATSQNTDAALTPFTGGLGLFSLFLLPGLIVGVLLNQVSVYESLQASVYEQLPAPLYGFSEWLDERQYHVFTVYQAILIVSTTHYLTTSNGHRWSSFIFSLILTLLCVSIQWYSTGRFVNYGETELTGQEWPRVLSMALTVVLGGIAIPFYRTIFQRKQSFTHYSSLFEFGWNQSVVMVLAALFVGVVQILILVATVLFNTIGIDVAPYVWDSSFQMPVMFASFAVGIGISRQYESVIHALVSLITGLFRALLPIQILIVVVYIGMVALSGHNNFDSARELKIVFLIAVGIGLTLCTAAVGHKNTPISKWLSISWRSMSIASVCLSIVAVYLVIERIKSYGYTHVHSLAGVLTLIGLLYSAGYAVSALLKNRGPDCFKRVNIYGSLVVFFVAIAIQTPMFDLVTHAAENQSIRIKRDGDPVASWKLKWLEQQAGAAGQRVLDELYADASFDLPPRSSLSRIRGGNATLEDRINEWHQAVQVGSLGIQPGPFAESSELVDALRKELTLDWHFKDHCLENRKECRVMITDDIALDRTLALVISRVAPTEIAIGWYRLDDDDNWQGEIYNFSGSGSINLGDGEMDILNQFFEDFDNGIIRRKKIEVNAFALDGEVIFPPWDLVKE